MERWFALDPSEGTIAIESGELVFSAPPTADMDIYGSFNVPFVDEAFDAVIEFDEPFDGVAEVALRGLPSRRDRVFIQRDEERLLCGTMTNEIVEILGSTSAPTGRSRYRIQESDGKIACAVVPDGDEQQIFAEFQTPSFVHEVMPAIGVIARANPTRLRVDALMGGGTPKLCTTSSQSEAFDTPQTLLLPLLEPGCTTLVSEGAMHLQGLDRDEKACWLIGRQPLAISGAMRIDFRPPASASGEQLANLPEGVRVAAVFQFSDGNYVEFGVEHDWTFCYSSMTGDSDSHLLGEIGGFPTTWNFEVNGNARCRFSRNSSDIESEAEIDHRAVAGLFDYRFVLIQQAGAEPISVGLEGINAPAR